MAKRTLADARQTLDDLAPALNPEMYRRHQQEIHQASAAALTLATRYVNERVTDTLADRQDVLGGWCGLRDAYTALAAEAADGRVTARDVNERLAQLRQQHRRLERHGSDLGRAVEVVEGIETDPEGWADETFYAKYPHMTPEFSF